MELKKNSKADLEKSKSIFFLVGLLLALGAVFAAFTVSSKTEIVDVLTAPQEVIFEEEGPEITRPEELKVTPPPPPKQVVEVLNIVDDTEDIDEEFVPEDTAPEEDDEIFFKDIPKMDDEDDDEEKIFVIVEKMPVFPGGDIGLQQWIAKNVKYPNIARETGIEGKVYVRFCVTKNGKVAQVSIARGVDPILDRESVRVVSKLPTWQPGEQRGEKVNVWYTVPINFKLQ